jgi:acetyl-CoA synthetase
LTPLPHDIAARRVATPREPLGAELADWVYDMFGTPLHEHYDRPELGAVAGYPHHEQVAVGPRPGSAGVALPGWRLAILDPVDDCELKPGETGRLAVDTAASELLWFSGYHGGAAATSHRFSPNRRWLLTGDAGTCDEEGYVYFSSRDHDAIVTGGYRVNPLEVEAALVAHPAVSEAAVFGEPDEINGRIVAAEVVLADGEQADAHLSRELQDFVRDRFAGHAGPHRIAFVTHLPRSASGKMRRHRTASA